MVSIVPSERNRFPIMALLALQAFDIAFASLGGQSANGTHGAGMTWSLIPKRLPMEVDRWVILSSSSVYLLGLSKHKVIGNDKKEGGVRTRTEVSCQPGIARGSRHSAGRPLWGVGRLENSAGMSAYRGEPRWHMNLLSHRLFSLTYSIREISELKE